MYAYCKNSKKYEIALSYIKIKIANNGQNST